MKTKLVNLLFFSLSFSLYQCDNNDIQNSNLPKQINAQENSQNREINARKNAEINLKNEQTWEKVQKLRISDTDFLKTKQPMSDDAIAPYDYHTGLVGDKAYNQVVYLKALERAKKHLSVEKNRLVLMLKKGVEINIAEDLFKYVAGIIDMWNNGIEDGKYRIIKTEQGYYDIFPIFENKSSSRVSAVNLSSMNDSQRWIAIKSVVDTRPIGTYIGSHFILNFGGSISGEYKGTDSKIRRYYASDACAIHGVSDPMCIHNYIASDGVVTDSQFSIYTLRNTNNLGVITYQGFS